MLAAIEIYNKPTVEHREQTLAMLLANAWEILLKARIVQESGGKLPSIYRRAIGRYERDSDTNEPMTIGLRQALGRVSLPGEVAANIRGILAVRNSAAHMGVLAPEVAQRILGFGAASVQNFVKLVAQWFGVYMQVPYLLPVGFLGEATMSTGSFPKSQQQLLAVLEQIGRSTRDAPESEFAVFMRVDINLNRRLVGGGSITSGVTNDPAAPLVRVSDTEVLERFPATYQDVVSACKDRYPGFKRNLKFNSSMARVKSDPKCAYERRLDPQNPNSVKKVFYDLGATLARLDEEYARAR